MNALQSAAIKIEQQARSEFRNIQRQSHSVEMYVGDDLITVKLTHRMTLHSRGINVNFSLNGKRIAFAKLGA